MDITNFFTAISQDRDSLETVKYLVELGNIPSSRNLVTAISKGHIPIIKFFLDVCKVKLTTDDTERLLRDIEDDILPTILPMLHRGGAFDYVDVKVILRGDIPDQAKNLFKSIVPEVI